MHISRFAISFVAGSIILLLSLITFPISVSALPHSETREYIFAVVPQSSPEVMHRNWTPVIERLSRNTGIKLKLKVYENMDDFEGDIMKGNAQFMYLNAAQAVMAWKEHKYIPLVRGSKAITGTLFVRSDSAIKSINELKGKEIAFVGPKNICTRSLSYELRPLNITPRYVGTSSNVYKHVLIGEVDAGGTLDVALDAEKSDVTQSLRQIYKTQSINAHPVSAHPSVDPKTRQKMRSEMLKLAKDPDGRALLDGIRMQDPVAADYARDYKSLEVLFGKAK